MTNRSHTVPIVGRIFHEIILLYASEYVMIFYESKSDIYTLNVIVIRIWLVRKSAEIYQFLGKFGRISGSKRSFSGSTTMYQLPFFRLDGHILGSNPLW